MAIASVAVGDEPGQGDYQEYERNPCDCQADYDQMPVIVLQQTR